MAVLACGVFLLTVLDSYPMLIIIGVLFGFGALMPALNALVVDETPPQERGSALGFFTSFMDLGITVGSMGLGLVGELWGYPALFGVDGLVVVAGTAVFALAAKPQSQLLDHNQGR